MQKFHETVKDKIDHEFTIYERKPSYLSERIINGPPSKWLACRETSETLAVYYTGLVQHVIIDKCGSTWIGMSLCSKRDTFNKKIGRAIAKGRAEKAYYLSRSGDEQDQTFLTPVSITSGGFLKKEIHGVMYAGNGQTRRNEHGN